MISFCKFCSKFTSGTFDAQYCNQCHVWFRANRTTFYMRLKNGAYEIDVDMGNNTTSIKGLREDEFNPSYDTRYMTWFGSHIMTVNQVPPEITLRRVEEWASKLLKLAAFS